MALHIAHIYLALSWFYVVLYCVVPPPPPLFWWNAPMFLLGKHPPQSSVTLPIQQTNRETEEKWNRFLFVCVFVVFLHSQRPDLVWREAISDLSSEKLMSNTVIFYPPWARDRQLTTESKASVKHGGLIVAVLKAVNIHHPSCSTLSKLKVQHATGDASCGKKSSSKVRRLHRFPLEARGREIHR